MTITDIWPVSYPSAGTIRVQAYPTAAVPASPTLAEINAGSGFDVTCYFPADAFSITHDQERIDDTRLCDATTRETFGRSSFAVDGGISYVWAPGAAITPAVPGNMAYSKFLPGETWFLGVRFGTAALPSGAAIVAAQKFDIYQIKFGDRNKQILSGGDAKHLITQQTSLARLAVDYAIPSA